MSGGLALFLVSPLALSVALGLVLWWRRSKRG